MKSWVVMLFPGEEVGGMSTSDLTTMALLKQYNVILSSINGFCRSVAQLTPPWPSQKKLRQLADKSDL